jgi:putative ABC transport system substrate-binding protein
MRLIGLAVVLALVVALADLNTEAQQPQRIYRIGYLSSYPPSTAPFPKDLADGLRDLGYGVGANLVIEQRFPFSWSPQEARLDALVTELAAMPVDVIVAAWNPALFAVRRSATTIPTVMVGTVHPVEHQLITSLSRPGSNMTGLLWDVGFAKQLETFKEAIPTLSRVAVLRDASGGWDTTYWSDAEIIGTRLGIRLLSVVVRDRQDLESAFSTIAPSQVDALIMTDSLLFRGSASEPIMRFARTHQLPVLSPVEFYVPMGALMSYGLDERALFRQAATYVDRILKGAKPGEMPVERPAKFRLTINMNTAKTLGLTIPPSLLLWADKVIE